MKKEINQIVTSTAKVRFSDCDPFNHLNNSRFIDYFLNAREDHVEEQFGLNIYKMAEKTGTSWIVGTNQIMYFKPAFLSEKLILESQLISYTGKTISVEMRMFNAARTHLKSFLWSDFVYINLKNGKVQNHEPDIMDMFKTAYLPIDQSTFKERGKFLLQS